MKIVSSLFSFISPFKTMKSCRYCRKFGNSFFCYTRKKNYLFENLPKLYSSGSWQFSIFLLLSGLLLSWILLKLPHRLIYFLIFFHFRMGFCFLQEQYICFVNDISDHPIFFHYWALSMLLVIVTGILSQKTTKYDKIQFWTWKCKLNGVSWLKWSVCGL